METSKKIIFAYTADKLGMGEVVFSWQPGCKLLSFCGDNRVVIIVDRLGKKMIEFQLKFGGKVKGIEFDSEGDTIAVIQENCSVVSVFNIYTKKSMDIEIDKSNKDKPTLIRWAKNYPTLAIGSEKGYIYYYSKKTDKIVPCGLNHSKKIVSGDWNDEGNLATGGEDKMIAVTNRVGDPILQGVSLKYEPKVLRWARQKTNDSRTNYTTISTILNNKTILIYDIKKKSNPIELALDQEYGNIVTYQWYGDGYIAIGFSRGFVSIISTHMTEIKNEVHSMQPYKNALDDISVCDEVNRLAVGGENSVKIYDITTWKEILDEKIEIAASAGRISKISWSSSGQILIVTTLLGSIFAFNVIVNDSFAVSGNLFTCLFSINEIVTYQIDNMEVNKLYDVPLIDEPKFFVVSQVFFAASYGTKIQIIKTKDVNSKAQMEKSQINKEFSSIISMLAINKEYIAILTEGRINFMKIEGEVIEKIFPIKDTDDTIYFVALTDEFLIYSDSNNKVKMYHIAENCANVSEYKFDNPIKKIFPNLLSTKIVCIDNLGKGHFYNPVTETVIPINNDIEIVNILFDETDSNLFVTVNKNNYVHSYLYSSSSLEGQKVTVLREYVSLEDLDNPKIQPYNLSLENGCHAFYLYNGFLFYYHKNTKEIKGNFLLSHYWINNWRENGDNEDGHKKYFMQNFNLQKFWNCLKAINFLTEKTEDYYERLGREALRNCNIEVAEESFRKANNISLVLTVQSFKHEFEKNILLGHIASILGDENLAQELFIKSSKPELALDLRCDLQDWQIALKLAKTYKPHREPFISRKLAYMLETQNNYAEAIKLYEKSLILRVPEYLNSVKNDHVHLDEISEQNTQCYAGISRCSFKLGDTQRGLNLALELQNKNLIIEIASMCESIKSSMEAARIYQFVEMYEKAATIYIQLKHFKAAEQLIDKIKSPKLLSLLAKMKESEKLYKDAEKAYEAAGDWDNVIRINLKFLDNPEKAKAVIHSKSRSEVGALMLADYYEEKGKKKEAIEFLLIAKKFENAFIIAQSHNEMDAYAKFFLLSEKNPEEFKRIAQYYEGKNEPGKAGIFYEKFGNFQKALALLIKGGEEYIDRAVEMVGGLKNDALTAELTEFLLTSSMLSVPKSLFKLYILLGKFKQASEISITLSVQEMELGKYKNARDILFAAYRELKERFLPVSLDLNKRLSILHSYTLARVYTNIKDHYKAAKLLLRVANHITMFEKHLVEILTSCVIETRKANLKKASAQWALELMKPEFRDKIPKKFKESVENVVRNAYKVQEDDEPEKSTLCPFCNTEVLEYTLDCKNCANVLPFCIASGKHMVLSDVVKCPSCAFPAIGEEMKVVLGIINKCPMCDQNMSVSQLEKIEDTAQYLKSRKILYAEENKDQSQGNVTNLNTEYDKEKIDV